MSFTHEPVDCANCKKRFTSVFCKVENDSMAEINDEKICTPYKKGQVIFHEDSRPLGIFCVNRGKIKLVKIGEDGKEQILRLIKPGDLMGYRALLSGDKYSASAVVMEEAFDHLDAPLYRVTSVDVPLPYAVNLEKMALPQVADIIQGVKAVCYRT